jgi:hypothetical protein
MFTGCRRAAVLSIALWPICFRTDTSQGQKFSGVAFVWSFWWACDVIERRKCTVDSHTVQY